jgi:hypothetical protein
MFIWLVVAVLVAILFGIRRRRDRARLARLRETEPPDEPAYWLERDEEPAQPPTGGPGGDGRARTGEDDAPPRSGRSDESDSRA